MMALDDIRQLVEHQFPFLKNLGLKVLELSPGRVKLLLPLKGNENHVGIAWAGALFTLAEVPGGVLAYSAFDEARFYPVAKEVTIRYLKPATTDVTVEIAMDRDEIARIEALADETGKADFTLDEELVDAQGNVVAKTRGFYQLRKF